MNFASLKDFAPHRSFLIQGGNGVFDNFIEEAKMQFALVHGLCVPRFTMDQSKSVASFLQEGDGSERLMIVFFSVFSPDAAQVLLKSLEEPAPLTTIIFITPHPYTVPQTIRSRIMLLQNTLEIKEEEKISKSEAISFIKEELSSDSDEDAASRRAKAVDFLDRLENVYKKAPKKSQTIYEAKKMLFKANIPTKYVIEYVVSCIF